MAQQSLVMDTEPPGLLDFISVALDAERSHLEVDAGAAAVVLAWHFHEAADGSCAIDPSSPPSLAKLANKDCYLVTRVGSSFSADEERAPAEVHLWCGPAASEAVRSAAVGSALALERALAPPAVADRAAQWIRSRATAKPFDVPAEAARSVLPPRARLRAAATCVKFALCLASSASAKRDAAEAAQKASEKVAVATAMRRTSGLAPTLSLVVPKLDLRAAEARRDESEGEQTADEARRLIQGRDEANAVLPGESWLLSGEAPAADRKRLRALGVTHVLNAAAASCAAHFSDELTGYWGLRLEDTAAQEICCVIPDVIDYVEAAHMFGGVVLVHCRAGVSRSASLVISYVMWAKSLSAAAAHDVVRAARPAVAPHLGFMAQLRKWEQALAERDMPNPPALLLRITRYDSSSEALMVGREVPCKTESLDPRYCFVLRDATRVVFVWRGGESTADSFEAAKKVAAQLKRYRGALADPIAVEQGDEGDEFWRSLGDRPAQPKRRPQYAD